MATKTTGVEMTYEGSSGGTFTKTLSGMDATSVSDTSRAKSFAEGYSKIVAGTLTKAVFVEKTDVPIAD